MLVTIDCPHTRRYAPQAGRRIRPIYCVPDQSPEPKLGPQCRSMSTSACSRQLRTPRQISSHKPDLSLLIPGLAPKRGGWNSLFYFRRLAPKETISCHTRLTMRGEQARRTVDASVRGAAVTHSLRRSPDCRSCLTWTRKSLFAEERCLVGDKVPSQKTQPPMFEQESKGSRRSAGTG